MQTYDPVLHCRVTARETRRRLSHQPWQRPPDRMRTPVGVSYGRPGYASQALATPLSRLDRAEGPPRHWLSPATGVLLLAGGSALLL